MFLKTSISIFTSGSSLIAGNYVYAYLFAPHDWAKAFEHSFFQAIATLFIWACLLLTVGRQPAA